MNEQDLNVEAKAMEVLENNLERKTTYTPAFRVTPGATGRMTKGDKLRARRQRLKESLEKQKQKEEKQRQEEQALN